MLYCKDRLHFGLKTLELKINKAIVKRKRDLIRGIDVSLKVRSAWSLSHIKKKYQEIEKTTRCGFFALVIKVVICSEMVPENQISGQC